MIKVTREKKREIVRQKRYGKKDEHCQVEIKIEGKTNIVGRRKRRKCAQNDTKRKEVREKKKKKQRESEKVRDRSKEERYRVRIKIESKKQSRGDVAKIAN